NEAVRREAARCAPCRDHGSETRRLHERSRDSGPNAPIRTRIAIALFSDARCARRRARFSGASRPALYRALSAKSARRGSFRRGQICWQNFARRFPRVETVASRPTLSWRRKPTMDSLFEEAPALTEEHARLARSLARFVEIEIEPRARLSLQPQAYREMAAVLPQADLFRYPNALPSPPLDMRALCIVRERLAHASPAADYLFATQGLASYPLALAAPDHLRDFWLSRIAAGRAIAAISLPTDDAGPTARRED